MTYAYEGNDSYGDVTPRDVGYKCLNSSLTKDVSMLSRIFDLFHYDFTNVKAKFQDQWDEICLLILIGSMEQVFPVTSSLPLLRKIPRNLPYCRSLFDVTLPLSKQECIKAKAFL